MDEDVIIIDADGAQRNAVIVRRPNGAPPIVGGGNGRPSLWNPAGAWTRPPAYYPPAYPAPVPAVYQPLAPPPPAKSAAKTWIPDIVDVLATLTPLPAPPVATGDPLKDMTNAMAYAGSLAATFKRADMLHTIARIAEKRL